MKKLMLVSLVTLFIGACPATLATVEQSVVVPFGFEDTWGSGQFSVRPISPGNRVVVVYDNNLLGAEGPIYITGVSFRAPQDSSFLNQSINEVEVRAGITTLNPEQIPEPVDRPLPFTAITGSSSSIVYPKAEIAFGPIDGTRTPEIFNFHVKFSNPFLYDSSKGNLFLDFNNGEGKGVRLPMDATSSPYIKLAAGPASSDDYGLVTGGPITQFHFIAVPEPALCSFALLIGTAFLLIKTKKRP